MIDLDVNRRLTTAFIAQYPVVITLTPHQRVRTANGGYQDVTLPDRAPQTMTLVQSPVAPDFPAQGTDGPERSTTYELVAEWDALIAERDTFTMPGQTGTWVVDQLFVENGWERRAMVRKVG